MKSTRRELLLGSAAAAIAAPGILRGAVPTEAPMVEIAAPMVPPEWALLERAVLDQHEAACEAFFDRYFDTHTGYLRAIERWGGDDGPDDAIENVNDWPHVYQLGGAERIRELYTLAYEGHVRQYTAAKTKEVPLAREGMYFREFPVMMDWQHNTEGLSVFNVMGLGDPYAKGFRDRVRRFTGFYTGEDPSAPNYDRQHKLIRSMFNGSRGPLMRKATALDWAGDPVNLVGVDPSALLHGEHSYEQMLAHFKDYTDTVGDNPLNLGTTGLAMNAYMLAHEEKYRAWIIEYVDAWVARARANNDILPTNIGLDGTIGGEVGGKWYGGVYGWAFSPVVPMTGKREDRNRVPYTILAFLNAYLLTGDDKYLDVWRKMADRINANGKMIDGRMQYPTMYGDAGWYSYKPTKWNIGMQDIYLLTMKPTDRARAPDHPFFDYLDGKNPAFPLTALRGALQHLQETAALTRADGTSADMRFADTVMDQNPASVSALLMLMQGGSHIARPGWSNRSPNVGGALQFSRLRYFDADARRPGVPPDVAALVDTLTADTAGVTLVNCNPTEARTVIVQGGAYGEHQILAVSSGGETKPVDRRFFTVRLAPGCGARLVLRMRRFVNAPTLDFPWGGPWVDEALRLPAAKPGADNGQRANKQNNGPVY